MDDNDIVDSLIEILNNQPNKVQFNFYKKICNLFDDCNGVCPICERFLKHYNTSKIDDTFVCDNCYYKFGDTYPCCYDDVHSYIDLCDKHKHKNLESLFPLIKDLN